MARATFVKRARKAIKHAGIKKGDSYWWWKFRHGPKRVSKDRPKPSQLTQSEYLSSVLSLEEQYAEISCDDIETAAGDVEGLADELENVKSEQEDKASNLENAFPNGCPSLELIQQRIEQCDSMMDSLRQVAEEIRSIDTEEIGEDSSVADEIRSKLDEMNWEIE